jgi:uncharacterized membrane protein
MNRLGVMNFLATNFILFTVYHEFLSSKSSTLMTLSLGGIVDSQINEKFAHYRWFKGPATPRAVLVLVVADNRSSPHHRQTWLK